MREALLQVARTLSGADMSRDSRQTIARVILSEIIEKLNAVKNRFPFNSGHAGWHAPYGREYVVAVRKQLDFFLDAWLTVANTYLEDHRGPPSDSRVGAVIYS